MRGNVELVKLEIASWVVATAVVMETLALLFTVGRISEIMEAPPSRRRRVFRRLFRFIGIWQITIGAFIVVFNLRQGEGWGSSAANSTSLVLMGSLFLLVPWLWVPNLIPKPGEEPDLQDPKDVERWLGEPDR